MALSIYLAGPCDSEHRTLMMNVTKMLCSAANALEQEIYIHCPWETKIPNAWEMSQECWARAVFESDIEAMKEADVALMISFGRQSTAGVNWENGFLYALGKPVWVIQITEEPTSIMTYCGCSHFISANYDNLIDKIIFFIRNWNKSDIYQSKCLTVLT